MGSWQESAGRSFAAVLGAVISLSVVLFLGMFALDAFTEGKTFLKSLLDFLIHAAPAIFLLITIAIAWKREWVGGIIFTAIALYYAVTTLQRLDWVLLISGPILVVGILYFWSWRYHASH